MRITIITKSIAFLFIIFASAFAAGAQEEQTLQIGENSVGGKSPNLAARRAEKVKI